MCQTQRIAARLFLPSKFIYNYICLVYDFTFDLDVIICYRYNLDPAGELDDNKLWKALESVQLKEFIESLPEKLG